MADDRSVMERLWDEGWKPETMWSNGPGADYQAHQHGFDKILVVVAGSIRFGLPDRRTAVQLVAGDRLDLPAGTSHDAVVGADGVTCVEVHVPVGTLTALTHRPAGEW